LPQFKRFTVFSVVFHCGNPYQVLFVADPNRRYVAGIRLRVEGEIATPSAFGKRRLAFVVIAGSLLDTPDFAASIPTLARLN
jgi:hypothetical protein